MSYWGISSASQSCRKNEVRKTSNMRNINIRDKIWSLYSRIWTKILRYYHWIKSPYSEFFCSVIFLIRTECEDLHCKPPYLVRMRENTVQKNTNYRHLSQSVCILCIEREAKWITNPQRRSMHRCKVTAQSYGTQRQTSLVILTGLKLELCVVNDTVWFMSMRQEIIVDNFFELCDYCP